MSSTKHPLSPARLGELHDCYRDSLLDDVLPFWLDHAIDDEHGGYLTCLDQNGAVVDTDKCVWQQGRFSWLLGELYRRVESSSEWLGLAQSGLRFIDQHCVDPADGRLWFHVTRDGQPIRKRRYAFSESFAAIANGEMARITGEESFATRARELFARFRDHQLNPPAGTQKTTQVRPTQSIGFSMIELITAQELRESIRLEGADELIDAAIHKIETCFVDESNECVYETVGADGKPIDHFDGRTLNPGHAIEASWFVLQEGKVRQDRRLVDLGCRMLDWMWQRGWDEEHGGILYFVSVDGRPMQEYWHDMKFWWPQCETLIATLLAYQLTGNVKYAQQHEAIHAWCFEHFPDSESGEWFGYLHRDGSVSSTAKGNFWKGPFHLPRMLLECWFLANELIDDPTIHRFT